MSKRIKGITIEIGGETKGLDKALSGLTKQAMSTGRELKDVERLLKLNPGNTELVAQKQALLAKQVENTSDKLRALKDAQGQVQSQFEKGEIGEEQYRAFAREVEATEGALNGYKGQLSNVQGEQDRLAQNTKRLDTIFEATSTSVEDFRDILGSRLTNAIQNGTASADDMEVALNKIGRASLGNEADIGKLKTTLDSMDDGQSIENVRAEIDKLGGTSLEATEKVSKLTEIVSSQMMMDVADKAAEASEKIIEIGKAGIVAAADMQASEAQFSQVFGNMEDKAHQLIEKMAADMGILPKRLEPGYAAISSQLMSLGIDQEKAMKLAEQALISSADAAAFYDISLEDAQERVQSFIKGNTNAAEGIGIFATASSMASYAISNGFIEASEEQQAFSQKMELSVEKAQKKVQDAINKYGESSLEARSATQKLNEELEKQDKGLDLTNKWNDLSEAQKQAVRVDYITNMQEMGNVTGQAAREMDGYENVMGNMASATDTFMAAIGDEALAIFIDIAMALIPVIQQLAEWIQNLNPMITQFVTIFAGAIAIVGMILPVLAALGAVAMATGVTIGTLVTATILPIIGIIAAIAAGITAIILVIQNWGTIIDWLREVFSTFGVDIDAIWTTIETTISTIVQSVVDFVMEIWGTLSTWWTENNQLILDTVSTIWNLVQSVVSNVLSIVVPLVQAAWSNISAITSAVWSVIQTVISVAINVILGVIKTVMQIIQGDWSGAWNTIKSVLSSVWSGIQNVVNTGVNFINNIVSNTFNGLVGTIKGIWNTISNTISSAINTAKNAVKVGIDAIKGLFNFKFSWPHIPLPHFSISGSANPLDWIKNGPPKLNVSWFAKGGILTKPTVFGMNGNTLMAGGEAGNEAVIPLNEKTLGMIGKGIADATRRKEAQSKEPTVIQNYFQFDKLIWQGKNDIRKTMEEMAFITEVDARGM